MAEPNAGGATPQGSDPAAGATPGGQQQGPADGATPTPGSSTEGATPDTQLTDAGRVAIEKERNARRDAERRAAEYRTRLQEIEDANKPELERAQTQAKRSQLEAETHKARITELEAEIRRRDLEALKAQVAAEAELPVTLAGRLQGDDLRSLRADAKEMAAQLRTGQAGSFRVGEGGSAAGGTRRVDMNQMIREAAGRG
jgi:hypothetical protein